MSWRPRNETQDNLKDEEAAANVICSKLNVTYKKLSERLYEVDWAFFRNDELVAWGEYKKRKKRYETLLLSVAKYCKMIDLSRLSMKPSYLFIEWPDGIFFYKVEPKSNIVIKQGGNDRGQNGDIEPVVHFPTNEFKRLAS